MKLLLLALLVSGCAGFKAKRVDNQESDEKSLSLTGEWMSKDTDLATDAILKQIKEHPALNSFFNRYHGRAPIFIAEIQNQTAEPFFPIGDFNDALLTKISQWGKFTLVDNKFRDQILKEITYQQDGMVDPKTATQIGGQIGAKALIFGAIYMKPATRRGKTLREYSVNVHLTDLKTATEIVRARTQINKYSNRRRLGL